MFRLWFLWEVFTYSFKPHLIHQGHDFVGYSKHQGNKTNNKKKKKKQKKENLKKLFCLCMFNFLLQRKSNQDTKDTQVVHTWL